jgi:ATP-dependent exoDNAse (exonuclease V) alpha subunit
VQWGPHTYKVGDPILFNESNRFAPLIYNNLKGEIISIEKTDDVIYFSIEVYDIPINEIDAENYGFVLLGISPNGNAVIQFNVNRLNSTDDDDESLDTVVPFQIAYAVSIHKAQGLEYNSVKIVITNEVEEIITHNIFYTAITRAKKNLKIYWTPETGQKILKTLTPKFNKKDWGLLKSKYSELA